MTTTATEKEPKRYDDRGHLIVEFGNKVATLHELDGSESIKADAMVGAAPNALVILKVYTCFALSGLIVDGVKKALPPATNDMNIHGRAKFFTARELTTAHVGIRRRVHAGIRGRRQPKKLADSPTRREVGELIALGLSYADAMAVPRSERYVMRIVLGRIHGGEYDFKKREWTKPPMVM